MKIQAAGSILELCILSVVSRQDAYGYQLIQSIAIPFGLSESTLYPVLRKLHRNGYLNTYDQNHAGRNRRYYQLTEAGMQYLEGLKNEWDQFEKTVDEMIRKDDGHE